MYYLFMIVLLHRINKKQRHTKTQLNGALVDLPQLHSETVKTSRRTTLRSWRWLLVPWVLLWQPADRLLRPVPRRLAHKCTRAKCMLSSRILFKNCPFQKKSLTIVALKWWWSLKGGCIGLTSLEIADYGHTYEQCSVHCTGWGEKRICSSVCRRIAGILLNIVQRAAAAGEAMHSNAHVRLTVFPQCGGFLFSFSSTFDSVLHFSAINSSCCSISSSKSRHRKQ